MWAKMDQPGAVYYDITWTHFCGDNPPEDMRRVFEVVTGARDAAIQRVKDGVASGNGLRGFEVDDAARGVIRNAGFAEYFTHGNRIELKLDRGAAEVVWVSPSTFHFRRVMEGPLPPEQLHTSDGALELETTDTPAGLRMRSADLELIIEKHGLLVRARKRDGS